MLKMIVSAKYGAFPTEQQREHIKQLLKKYVDACYDHEFKEKMRDVYVTDHQPKEKKLLSDNEAEDQDYYNYEKAVEEYNKTEIQPPAVFGAKKSEYKRGTLV